MTYDELMEKQTPEIQAEIEAIVNEAGTSDADWGVLEAAGKRAAHLRSLIREASDFVNHKYNVRSMDENNLRVRLDRACSSQVTGTDPRRDDEKTT